MKSINIGLRELEAILEVGRNGNFRSAAIALGLSQPAVSSRIRQAEDLLGIKLFHRTTRKVSLTKHGERLYVHAERTLSELASVVEEFKDEARLKRGRVAVGVTPTIAASAVFSKVLLEFGHKWPGIELVLRDDFSGRAFERLIAGEVDFVLTPAIGRDARLDFKVIAQEELVLICREDHPLAARSRITLADTAQYPLMTTPAETPVWDLMRDRYSQEGLSFNPAFASTNVTTLVALVRTGWGISFLPTGMVPILSMRELCISSITPRPIERPISIATAKGRAVQPGAKTLIATLVRAFNGQAREKA
jgi:LysR family transcriptional regulator, carnitine catabolism transcriptional activator